MTSSFLKNKISDLQEKFKAESEAFNSENNSSESTNPFGGSRPGSGRRPKQLGDVGTPTRIRRPIDIPGSYAHPPQESTQDVIQVEQKMKEIMKKSGVLTINGEEYKSDIDDLEHIGELGNGTCGHVVKMLHKPSQQLLAVKQMRRSGNFEESKRIAMDLEVVLMSHDCDYIVHCLGCFITDSDVWICMELMGSCFDKLIKKLSSPVPEKILGKVTVATVKALHYLKENHGVMHRDVKPSNILIDEKGNVKLCDFGISGRLVDSKAKTKNAGCAAYMSPERINPPDPRKPDYDIRADVWSLGITLVELATKRFPYLDCNSDFEVLSRVLQDDPPTLPDDGTFSPEFRNFVQLCLAKDFRQRPKYKTLLEHPFIKRYEQLEVDVALWYNTESAKLHSPRGLSMSQKEVMSPKKSSSNVVLQQPTLKQSPPTPLSPPSSIDPRSSFAYDHKDLPSPTHNKHVNKPSQDWEKLKGVWNTIIKSPLFSRRKKSVDRQPPENKKQLKNACSSPPVSPLVLQRFLHQQIQHINGVKSFRSTSVSPSRHSRLREDKPDENVWADETKASNVGIVSRISRRDDGRPGHVGQPPPTQPPDSPWLPRRRTPDLRPVSASPEPPPRINKIVSPLLARRIAFNSALSDSQSQGVSQYPLPLADSPCLPHKAMYGGVPIVPKRRPRESSSVPCSPLMPQRKQVDQNYRYPYEVFNSSHYPYFT